MRQSIYIKKKSRGHILQLFLYISGFQPGMILFPQEENLAMSGDILQCILLPITKNYQDLYAHSVKVEKPAMCGCHKLGNTQYNICTCFFLNCLPL